MTRNSAIPADITTPLIIPKRHHCVLVVVAAVITKVTCTDDAVIKRVAVVVFHAAVTAVLVTNAVFVVFGKIVLLLQDSTLFRLKVLNGCIC